MKKIKVFFALNLVRVSLFFIGNVSGKSQCNFSIVLSYLVLLLLGSMKAAQVHLFFVISQWLFIGQGGLSIRNGQNRSHFTFSQKR